MKRASQKISMMQNAASIAGIALLTLLLPGCFDFSGKKEEQFTPASKKQMKQEEKVSIPSMAVEPGESIVLIDNVPVVTSGTVEKEKQKLIDANPQLKMVIDFMDPKEVNSNIAMGLLQQVIIDRYIAEEGIAENKAYQQELADGMVALQRMLNAKYFSDAVPVSVSDNEVRKFYDEKKDTLPGVVISRGGIQTIGIGFESEENAQAFLDLVDTHEGGVRGAAADQGLADKVRDFKLITPTSPGIDVKIKDAVISMRKIPSVQLVKSDMGEYWVIEAQSKKDSEYRPLDQVKADVRAIIEKQKREEGGQRLLEELRAKYHVTVNEEYLRAAMTAQEEMEHMQEFSPEDLEEFGLPELPAEISEVDGEFLYDVA